jgi:hypothetical protein
MEENIIFADDLMYQVSEESEGEVIITEVKCIDQKDKTSEFKQDDTVFQTKIDIKPDTRVENLKDLEEILHTPLEGDFDQDIALKITCAQIRHKKILIIATQFLCKYKINML